MAGQKVMIKNYISRVAKKRRTIVTLVICRYYYFSVSLSQLLPASLTATIIVE